MILRTQEEREQRLRETRVNWVYYQDPQWVDCQLGYGGQCTHAECIAKLKEEKERTETRLEEKDFSRIMELEGQVKFLLKKENEKKHAKKKSDPF